MKYSVFKKNGIFDRADYIFFLIIGALSLYLFVFKLPFPGTDDLVYKQPGASLAKGLGLTAPALKNYLPEVDRLFAHYPPIYPFLYGIWFSLFGFSFSSSLALSLFIAYLIAIGYVLLFKFSLKEQIPSYLYGLIFFSWCSAITAMHRPDILFILLALSLLLVVTKTASKELTFIVQFYIIFLLGLSLATSFGLGLLFIVYLFFVLISVKGLKASSVKTFCLWAFFGIALSLLIWFVQLYPDPYLIKLQFIDPYLFGWQLLGSLGMHNFINAIIHGSVFSFYRLFHYLPLIVFLSAVFIAYLLLSKEKEEKKFLTWQFSGLSLVLFFLFIKLTHKNTYITVFVLFLVFIYGIALVKIIEGVKGLHYKRLFIFITFVFLFISWSPSLRMFLLPLTWEKEDTYSYNKELIEKNIKKGSKVLTDVGFWYALNNDYDIYESYFASSNIYDCSYVLLRSGGSGKADLAVLPIIPDDQKKYFHENFTLQLNTMSDEPNKLFGLPISKSRWCYRFELYKRRQAPHGGGVI